MKLEIPGTKVTSDVELALHYHIMTQSLSEVEFDGVLVVEGVG